ncbi:MAG: cytochrome c3 family protein [Planctomycetota bacterium]
MRVLRRVRSAIEASRLRLVVLGLLVLSVASCSSSDHVALDTRPDLNPGWPKGREPWTETSPQTVVPVSWTGEKASWSPTPIVPVPEIPHATVVGMDDFCETCHETYTKAFAGNVHRDQGCEKCHGGASIHLESRGREPATILSLRPSGFGTSAGKSIHPAERSEVCLECHEQGSALSPEDPHLAISTWRISAHSHQGIACTDCHRAHYSVPPGTPIVEEVEETAWADPLAEVSPESLNPATLIRVQEESLNAPPSATTKSLAAVSPDICYPCHADMRRMEEIVHPHQIGVPLDFPCTSCHDPAPRGLPHLVANHPTEFNCTTCHDAHGNILAETRKNLCLKCHGGAHMGQWYSSPHAAAGVACTDCHNPHSETGPPMHVDEPQACYRCHDDKRDLERIAHPHQVRGPNGFNCTTCHDPHGKVVEATRKDQCLECHDGAPTMAWHSSTHNREGVACTDCHNPHPRAEVPRVVNVSHTAIKRPGRLPMSVDEPEACFKCHQKIYAFTALPSHHPIAEGKMVCSDCHDAHGQARGHLKEATVNEVCYECHAEKEGPFAYEHAPVTENCAYCHEPHGTVENNLLRQPTTFLCLRCHSGHSTHGQSEQCFRCHFVDGDLTNVGGGPLDPTIATTPATRRALFTDCTQCHTQIHGSDLPSGFECFGRLQR